MKKRRQPFLLAMSLALGMLSSQASAAVLLSFESIPVDRPATLLTKVPFGVNVYLDRVVYTDRDRDGQGLVVINPPSMLYDGSLKDHRVKLEIIGPDGKALGAAMETPVTDSDHFAIDLNIPDAPMGEIKLIASLIDATGKTLASGQKQFTKKHDASPALPSLPLDVPLVITTDQTLSNNSAIPMTTGIPLPDGLLDDASNVTLFENGKPIPCQTTVRARWTRRGSIKWLGLDFQARFENGMPVKYTLRIGATGTAVPAKPITLTELPEAYVINNGVLEVTVSRLSFKMFDKVILDRNKDGQFTEDETIVNAKPTDGPYWENAAGKIFYAAMDQRPQIRVEEQGKLRTTIRVDGWLTAEDGTQAGRFISRINVYAGKYNIGVNHTQIITWDTNVKDMRVSDMGVKISPVALEKSYHMTGQLFDIPENGEVYQVFDRWDKYHVSDTVSNKPLASVSGDGLRHNTINWLNTRTPLAFGGVGQRGTVAVGQRYVAEKFPKEFSVGRDSLTWHAWPRHGTNKMTEDTAEENIGNLQWLHQGRLLDFQIPDRYFDALKVLKDENPDKRVTLLIYKDHDNYATGTAITGELSYYFAIPNTPDHNQLWANLSQPVFNFEKNPHAIADPTWSFNTGLLEFAAPVAPEYPEIERGLSTMFDRMLATIERDRDLGQFLWPNGQTYAGNTYSSLHRNRMNTHHANEIIGWSLYLRSGENKYWHFASALSRYLIDHASVNYDTFNPKTDPKPVQGAWPGSVFHVQGLVPWSDHEPELLGHMSPQWHACLLYYMTGDSQAMDLFKSAATAVLKSVRTENDYRVREPYKGTLNRNPASGWGMVTNLYAELLDPRLLRPVEDIGKQVFNGGPVNLDPSQPPEGQSGRWWWYTYTQQWRDPVAINAMLNLAPDGEFSFGGYYDYQLRTSGHTKSTYALWMETQGLAPLRQYGMGHPLEVVSSSTVGDNFNFLIPMVGAMKKLNLPEVPIIVPTGFAPTTSRVVFHKDSDRDFKIRFWGRYERGDVNKPGYKPRPYIVQDPNGKTVLEGEIDLYSLNPDPEQTPTITVPADGLTGDYTLRFTADLNITLYAPMSDLPKEVYVVPAGSLLFSTHIYWRTAANEVSRTLSPYFTRLGENYSMLLRLERTDGSLTKAAAQAGAIQLDVTPQTMYRLSMCVAGQPGYAWRWRGVFAFPRIVSPGPDMILSADESKWFEPKPVTLTKK